MIFIGRFKFHQIRDKGKLMNPNLFHTQDFNYYLSSKRFGCISFISFKMDFRSGYLFQKSRLEFQKHKERSFVILVLNSQLELLLQKIKV